MSSADKLIRYSGYSGDTIGTDLTFYNECDNSGAGQLFQQQVHQSRCDFPQISNVEPRQ